MKRPSVFAKLLASAVVFGGAAAAHATDAPPVPWPGGSPPDDATFSAQLADALTVGRRELSDDAVAAIEPSEDREHMSVLQDTVDQNSLSEADLFRRGDALFAHEFNQSDGFGAGPDERLHRIHSGVRGGLDTHSCAGCHTVGGLDGAGSETERAFLEGDGDRESSALVRNAPQIVGAGFVQALALEMTDDLSLLRNHLRDDAVQSGATKTVELVSKGVHFGTLSSDSNGVIDLSAVEGIDRDLVVRPFGWKGTIARLRRFVEDAARLHFGIQSTVLAANNQTSPDPAHLGDGPNWFDPDNDGVARELEEGSLSATGVYMMLLESPVISPPFDAGLRERWARGSAQFEALGCVNCHTRELPLYATNWRERPDTTSGPGVSVQVFLDGDQPRSAPSVKLFSDLKRHDMGRGLADPHDNQNGIGRSVYLTRPLWGLAESAPYLHDGRAATIPEAIESHGGEAQSARDAFVGLGSDARADLHVFLLSLSRASKVRMAR